MKTYRFTFTLLRPNDEKVRLLDKLPNVMLCIYGYEKGPVSGILHLQGYLELTEEMEVFKLKSLLKGYYIESARESREQNILYCKKGGIVRLYDPYHLTK